MKTIINTRFYFDNQNFNDKPRIRIIQNLTHGGCIYTVVGGNYEPSKILLLKEI